MIAKKWKITASVLIALLIFAIGFISFKWWREEEEKKGIILPYIAKKGEKITFYVFIGYKNGTGVEGVNVTLMEKETGISQTKTSQVIEGYSVMNFTAIVGRTYELTATLNHSTKSVTHTIGPRDAAVILISDENEIESITFFESLL